MRINKHLEAPVAHGGALLSRACVRFPGLIGRHVVGEATKQFTPLPYRVARTRFDQVDRGSSVTYPGNPDAGDWPKDYPTAVITTIAHEGWRAGNVGRLAVGWVFGRHLLVAPVPLKEIDPNSDTYSFAMRIGPENLHVVAGVLDPKRVLHFGGQVTLGEVMPVGEIPPEIPLH